MGDDKANYKINISSGYNGVGKGRSKSIEIEKKQFERLEGKKIGDTFDGGLVGFPNYEFQITGGCDTSGFAMRRDVHGSVKKKILLSKRGVGYKPKRKGEKRRKTVRGNEITLDIILINVKIVKYGQVQILKEK